MSGFKNGMIILADRVTNGSSLAIFCEDQSGADFRLASRIKLGDER